MKTRAKVGFIDTNNKLVKASEVKDENTNNQFENIPQGNRYLDALFLAIQEFVGEELRGCIFTERRLMSKIEAARTLFGEEQRSLGPSFRRSARANR